LREGERVRGRVGERMRESERVREMEIGIFCRHIGLFCRHIGLF